MLLIEIIETDKDLSGTGISRPLQGSSGNSQMQNSLLHLMHQIFLMQKNLWTQLQLPLPWLKIHLVGDILS